MTPSPRLIEFLHGFEKLSLKTYDDGYGFPTIGWGHLLRPREAYPNGITRAQADAMFAEDLNGAVEIVTRAVKVPLSQGQFDALVSFVFNVGPGRRAAGRDRGKAGFVTLANGNPSTMLRMLNDGNYQGAAREFEKWTIAGGKQSRGLLRRRKAEQKMFLEG